MKPNVDILKNMDNERLKCIEYAEKLRIKYAGTVYDTNTHDVDDDALNKVMHIYIYIYC